MADNYEFSGSSGKGKNTDFKKLGRRIVTALVVLILLIGIGTCFYTVDDKQQAVVTTFGKVTDVTEAGVHFKLPFGIQHVHHVDVNVYQKIELGYTSQGDGYVTNAKESTMITGDYNIVNVDFFVEYKISDPVKYLFASNDSELILRNLIQSQVRNVVGSTSVDDILTTGKENVQRQVKELVTQILVEYDIGLTLVDVRIQDSEPPTQNVVEAFKNVEFLKQKRINEAKEQVAMFNAMYEEYQRNPEITRSRMYYEAISQILPDVKLYINTSGSDDVQMLLPLDSLVDTDTDGGNE